MKYVNEPDTNLTLEKKPSVLCAFFDFRHIHNLSSFGFFCEAVIPVEAVLSDANAPRYASSL